MSQCHECSRSLHPWPFSSLKVGKLNFTLKPLPVHPDWPLSWETLIWLECCKLHSLCLSKLSPPKEGEPPEGFPRNPWGSLPPMPPLTLAPLLWVNAPSIGSAVCIIMFLFWLPIRGSLQAFTSTFQCHRPQLESWGGFAFPMVALSSGLHFLLYHSLNDGVATFLHGFPQSFCVGLPAQLNGPPKPNSTFLALQ